ncbi:PucR family transcriptional regulator [Gordonia desulfuricans]|uniref:PucR family transcriptional regulator n=1 Tax=Gordonia desulfuricans TaxID=89051 RepID=A0A7K3LWA9_9ACTN|nr:PucR family transcriptional regulator [Gordonia desulfuricans]NDK92524.1 PucR family transcriptional regulator [Gordonia desulfuricans]
MGHPETTPLDGVELGRLLLALDRTVATLVTAPAGLDRPIAELAMLDADDVELGLGRGARGAQLFLLVGVGGAAAIEWLDGLGGPLPVALMAKAPTPEVVERAAARGVAVIAVDPHARWERVYHLVSAVIDAATATIGAGESMLQGHVGDLFELAAEVARRTGGLISIEDERSHVLAYSSAGDEADELRRLSILGREGPPEMLAWLRQWGVMDALRTSATVVTVDARADLGLRPRRAVAIRAPVVGGTSGERRIGEFLGVVWLQQGDAEPAADADEVLIGAAAVAARVIVRRRAAGSGHDDLVRRLLGVRGGPVAGQHLGTELGIDPVAPVVVVGFGPDDPATVSVTSGQISALTLHASAFSPLSVTTTVGARAYVVLPSVDPPAAQAWAQTVVDATRRQFGLAVRAVIAGPATGVGEVPELRVQVDRVLDAAGRAGDLIDPVTTVAASRTGVVLGSIVELLSENPDLVDPRVRELVDADARGGSEFVVSLRAYLDRFGDVRAAAADLDVHPNTLRYRIRRLQTVTGMDLADPATRVVVALSLRVLMPPHRPGRPDLL